MSVLKLKLTPLNIVSAICVVSAVIILLDEKSPKPGHVDATVLIVGFSLLTAMIAFVSDLIFRKFIPSLIKLWIIESVLVAFIIILIFIIKTNIG